MGQSPSEQQERYTRAGKHKANTDTQVISVTIRDNPFRLVVAFALGAVASFVILFALWVIVNWIASNQALGIAALSCCGASIGGIAALIGELLHIILKR